MRRLVKVTAHLLSPLALSPDGVPPHLDALCELVMARKALSIADSSNGHRHAIDRSRPRGQPVETPGQLPIPIVRERVDGLPIPRCSQGIIADSRETAEHYHCAFPVERAQLLSTKSRTTLATTGGTYKSMRLPLRIISVPSVVWFAELREQPARLRGILRKITTLGKKAVYGYGLVGEWRVESTDIDAAWFAESSAGKVLMRPLPISIVNDSVLGKRRDFGAVCGPYWQANLFVDRWSPY